MASTTKCVICGNKATSFGGHVHKNEETIIAGLCKEHKNHPTNQNCKGCYGKYKYKMGYDRYFGEVCYITTKMTPLEKRAEIIRLRNILNQYFVFFRFLKGGDRV